jgi:solute carrier family 25 (mitochondrial S-adenosylmethionine transporter), member 26
MLDQTNGSYNIARILSTVYKTEGAGALFAGVYPRTFWITLGGFIYLGTLEKVKNMLMKC